MHELIIETERETQLCNITPQLQETIVGQSGMAVTLFVPHTTAGILLQAHGTGASEVAADVEAALKRLVSESWSWRHRHEGDQSPWAHARAALTASSVTIPFEADGRLALGEYQAVYLCEFAGPRQRRVLLTVS